MSKSLVKDLAFSVEFSPDVAEVVAKILACCNEKFPDFRNDQLINFIKQLFKYDSYTI